MGWLRQLFSRRRRYDELSESIHEHLDEKTADLMDRGMTREQAEATARREFGNVTLIEERSREVWQWPTLESLWADMRFALRQLVKSPGFTLTAVVTLTLGIAVNTTMFSMVSALLMPRLPGRDPQQIVVVSSVDPGGGFQPDVHAVSAPNFVQWRADTRVFADMAAADDGRIGSLVSWQSQPEAISYSAVTPNYFSLFGAEPMLGRNFELSEDQPGRDHVVILSFGLWKQRFHADPSVVGRTLRLDREDYTIVGVMPADFRLLGFTPQLWTPLTLSPADISPASRNNRYLDLFARPAPGVTLGRARAAMQRFAQQAQQDFPDTEKRWGASVRTLPDYLVYSFGIENALAVIMVMVSFVLLIACANVAGLLLTRATGRQKEMAIRVSLGASRLRIVRQLLTEGLVLAVAGGAAGLLLANPAIRWLSASLQFNEAISAVPVTLDQHVLWFAVCVSLASALVSSLAPALKASRADVQTGLRSESRTASAGRSHTRMRAVLVGGEFAMALFLLIGSALIIRGIYVLEHQKLGFRRDHLLTAGIQLDKARYGDAGQQLQFVRDLLPKLAQIPGVRDAAVTTSLPATFADGVGVVVQGETPLPDNQQRTALDFVVTPGYFDTIGLPLLRGRTFTDADDARAPRVAVVNREFVHRYLHDGNALGKQVQLATGGAPAWSQIIGVVGDLKSHSEETRIDPQIYEVFPQRPAWQFSIVLRTSVDPDSSIPALRRAVASLDPELPLMRTLSMEGVIDSQRNGDPLFTRLLATFALLALLLAAVGIYGLVAYSVSQRTHEIGIRLALGAKSSDVAAMVLREGLLIAAIGSVIGLVLALPLPRLFSSIFFGLHFSTPAVYPLVLAAMLLVGAVAILGPARRAGRIDPTQALRAE
jgi:predicted permease